MIKVIHIIPSMSIYGGAEKMVEKLALSNGASVYEIYTCMENINLIKKLIYITKAIFNLMIICNKFDILHFHLFPSLYISAFIPKKKVIIHEHNTYNRRREYSFLSILEGYIYKRASAVICISEAAKLSLEKWCGRIKNAVIMENFTRFKYHSTESRKINESGKTIRLLMVASFTDQKRHESLIRAFCYLPVHYELDLLGDGKNYKKIENLVYQLGLNKRIRLHGNVKNVADFFVKADICVLLSNWEGFGLVVVEAASFDKVTICSNVPGLSDVVANELLLIDNDKSIIELASTIESTSRIIMSEPKKFSSYCKELANRYSFDNYRDRLNNFYTYICHYN